jgi:hypothetical protein
MMENRKGILYLVPTPIGNIEDITYRSLKVLNDVDFIFCEDTRISKELLNYYKINKKLISSNEHNEEKRVELMLNYLKSNQNIAIITDRGTPIISDPGYILVKRAIEENFEIVALPGANAATTALIISGLEPYPYLFYGFLKGNNKKKIENLNNLKKIKYTMIFYESVHHIKETLDLIYSVFGNRKIAICRELTKLYEECIRDNLENLIKNINNITLKGEFVIVVEGNKNSVDYSDLSLIEHVNMYISDGFDKMESIKKTSNDLKLSKSEVYKKYHEGS